MSLEGISPEKKEDLRAQTLEAVQSGAALPTYEGMQDPEIAEAFRTHLENMSKEEFEAFCDDFTNVAMEALQFIANGDNEKVLTQMESVSGYQIQKVLLSLSTIGFSAAFGTAVVTGGPGWGVAITGLIALTSALKTLGASKQEQLGRNTIERAKKATYSLIDAMEEVQKRKEFSE